MPTISMFYGVVIMLHFGEQHEKHHSPHIHAEYQDEAAVFGLPDGNVIEKTDKFPSKKTTMIQTWIDIHKDELMANWKIADGGELPFRIKPLD